MHNIIFFIFSIITLILLSIAYNKCLKSNILLFSIFSCLSTVLYVLLNAPDVAITEASIGVLLSSVFIISALSSKFAKNMDLYDRTVTRHSQLFAGVVSILLLILLYFSFIKLPEFGNQNNIIHDLTKIYLEKMHSIMGFPNMVSAILASFRGFDTMIETTVVFLAGNIVYTILKSE